MGKTAISRYLEASLSSITSCHFFTTNLVNMIYVQEAPAFTVSMAKWVSSGESKETTLTRPHEADLHGVG